MAASVWSGYITFGLISIPVKLFSAARSEGVGFNMLHKECRTRVKQQYICPAHEGRVVPRDEMVKGYEYEKDQYIVIEPEEIKKIEPKTAKAMEILEFVPAAQVDPVFFDASFHLLPDEPGRRAYTLLKTALEQSGYLGIARVSMHNREYTVLLRPQGQGIMAHTMFYQNEIRRLEEMGPEETTEVKPKELELANSLIQSLAGDFDASKYSDQFAAQIRTLIDAKIQGQPVVEIEKPKLAPVIDLMAALKQSIEQMKKVPGKAAEAGASAAGGGNLAALPEEDEVQTARPQRRSVRARRGV